MQSRRPATPWASPAPPNDELLSIEQFDTLLEARVLVADWRTQYNDYRPHSALGMLTPTECARQWRTNHPNPS